MSLSRTEQRVLACITEYKQKHGRNPRQTTLAKMLSLSVPTIERAIRGLKRSGCIKAKRPDARSKKGYWMPNRYTLQTVENDGWSDLQEHSKRPGRSTHQKMMGIEPKGSKEQRREEEARESEAPQGPTTNERYRQVAAFSTSVLSSTRTRSGDLRPPKAAPVSQEQHSRGNVRRLPVSKSYDEKQDQREVLRQIERSVMIHEELMDKHGPELLKWKRKARELDMEDVLSKIRYFEAGYGGNPKGSPLGDFARCE
jgi:DNA-binding Lrp family transcriptional regulator